MKWTKILLAIALFFALSTMGQARGGGYYDSYNKGYNDGCYSSKYNSWRKNDRAYRYSARYYDGWNRGKHDCRSRYNNNRRYEKRRYEKSYSANYYNLGYQHGCRTARVRYTVDRYKYRNSISYRKGWNQGKRRCW